MGFFGIRIQFLTRGLSTIATAGLSGDCLFFHGLKLNAVT